MSGWRYELVPITKSLSVIETGFESDESVAVNTNPDQHGVIPFDKSNSLGFDCYVFIEGQKLIC